MAVGGAPNPEQWAKITRAQKIGYWICVGAVAAFIGTLLIIKFIFQ